MQRTFVVTAAAPALALAAVLTFALVAGGALAATTPATTPATKPTPKPKPPSPTALLLTRADLGSGWSVSSQAPRKVASIGCAALHLELHGGAAHPRAAAASATFGQGSSGPFVAQTAYEYANATDQRTVWKGVARRALMQCLAESFVHGAADGVQFTVVGKRALSEPRLKVKLAAYRITATAARPGQSVPAYLDVLVLASGDAVTELSVSNLVTPPASRLEHRLTGTIVRRMTAQSTTETNGSAPR
jgi:hypothetical protein